MSEKEDHPRLSTGFAALPNIMQLDLLGPDAVKFLQGFCTNDVKLLADGQGCEAFLCDVKGRVLALVGILKHPDGLTLRAVAADSQRVGTHLDRYIIRENVRVVDRSSTHSHLALVGPGAFEQVRNLFSDTPLSDTSYCGACFTRTPGAEDSAIVVQRLPFFGDDCWIVSGPAEEIAKTESELLRSDLERRDPSTLESRRIQSGWPIPGHDFDDKTLPQELDRDKSAISFRKGCYLGQETVARLDALGQIQRKLCLLKWDTPQRVIVEHGPLFPNSSSTNSAEVEPESATAAQPPKEIGWIGSVTSAQANAPQFTLAFVKRGYFSVGTVVTDGVSVASVVGFPWGTGQEH